MTKLGITRDPERMRRAGDEDELRMPQGQWAQLATVIMKLGPMNAIAVFLVGFLAFLVWARIDAHAAESRRDNDRQLRVLQQICVNTSPTPEVRGTCLSWSFDTK